MAPGQTTPLAVVLAVVVAAGVAAALTALVRSARLIRSRAAESSALAARLRHEQSHDQLTGLATRATVVEHLTSIATSPTVVGVAVIDVDRLAAVNESLGYERGDAVLAETAARIAALIPASGVAGRLGGDQFVAGVAGASDAALVGLGEAVRDAVTRPIRIAGTDVHITASVGLATTAATVAHSAAHAPDVAAGLIRDAALAAAEATRRGRDRVVLFDDSMRRGAQRRLHLREDLRRAVAADELEVHFQPIVDLGTGRVHGAEALLRWNHPERGLLTPEDWLDVADESGLLVEIGRRTLASCCRRFATLNHSRTHPLTVSVNLTMTEAAAPGLTDTVASCLADTGLPPAQLLLEVSEAVIADDHVAGVLAEVADLGVALAIDDFGTGYSSLRQLRRLPVDRIKIDQSFVAGLGTDDADTSVVEAICGLARRLGLALVAEGVTSEAQADRLRALGCRWAQGYLYGPPLPFARLTDFLDRAERFEGAVPHDRADGSDRAGYL